MAESPPEKTYAELARSGDLDALFGLIDLDSSSKNDRLAYKWLVAASDFGHDEASDRADDVLEVSSLRYDDMGYERAAAHWELGAAYLVGEDGLARDLPRAREHLQTAFRFRPGREVIAEIREGTGESYDPDELRARLDADAAAVLDECLAGDARGRVLDLLQRVQRLREIGSVPDVILRGEEQLLRAALAEIAHDDDLARRARDLLR